MLWPRYIVLILGLAGCKPPTSSISKVASTMPVTAAGSSGAGAAKGVADWSASPSHLSDLGVSWYYNWGPRPSGGTRAEFVPMVWGERDINDGTFAAIKSSSAAAVLAFNEPDQSSGDQSGMSVSRAADVWTSQLVPLGKRLGSPAATNYDDGAWLDQFMAAIDPQTVGFIAVHHYASDATNPDTAVQEYRSLLAKIHNKYQKPIWLTEFGGPAYAGQPTADQEAAFLRQVVAMLNDLGYVERYAWYSANDSKDGATYRPCELFDGGGSMTDLGTAYKALAGGSAGSAGTATSTQASTLGASQPALASSTTPSSVAPSIPPGNSTFTSGNGADTPSGSAAAANDPWGQLAAGIATIVQKGVEAAQGSGAANNSK